MRTIWKFPLLITDEQVLPMPTHSDPLHVGFQGDTLCLWVHAETDQERYPQTIHVYGTGNPIDVDCGSVHVGTVSHVVNGRILVWHVFWAVAE